MALWQELKITPGITAIIGSGGKTSLLLHLAQQLPERVIVCTTTRIYPPRFPVIDSTRPDEIERMLTRYGCICAARFAEQGKLSAPALPFEALAELAAYVLVEADGSKQLPLKAHLEHEPVIPPAASRRILVVGTRGFHLPIRQTAHRWEQFCRLSGALPDDAATPEAAARVIAAEALCDTVLVNPVNSERELADAQSLADHLPDLNVYAGDIFRDQCRLLEKKRG